MYSWQVTLKLSQLILKMHFLKGTYLLIQHRQMKFLHSQSQYHKIIFIRIITEKSHYWVYRTCALKKFTIF